MYSVTTFSPPRAMEKLSAVESEHGPKKKFFVASMRKEHPMNPTNSTLTPVPTEGFRTVVSDWEWTVLSVGSRVQAISAKLFHSHVLHAV
jgi:hypothetical protein